jgi:hypothetical protein
MNRWLVLLVLSSCGGSTPQGSTTPETLQARIAAAQRDVQVEPPALGEGVGPLATQCPGVDEVCNAIDDDCDNIVDEDCGLHQGSIQVTLSWTGGADLDLYVSDPWGGVVSYQSPDAPSGGHLDHEGRGQCDRRAELNQLENAYWDRVPPAPGHYLIEVLYWGQCGVAGDTRATVSISIFGRLLGSYEVILHPRERREIARFEIPTGEAVGEQDVGLAPGGSRDARPLDWLASGSRANLTPFLQPLDILVSRHAGLSALPSHSLRY